MPRIPRISIDQRPDGSYRVRWREHGRQKQDGGHTTIEEAEAVRFSIEARFRAGLPGARDRFTIRELITRWWDDYVLTLDYSTRATYKTSARRVLDTIGDADANRLTTPLLIAWRDELQLQITNGLVNDALKVLSSAYQRGVEWGLVEANPVRGVPRLPEPPRNIVIPTREEVIRLGITCPDTMARARFLIAACVGLRPAEQLALQWRHIHDRTIRVERALKPDGSIGPTKTKTDRSVPMPPSVIEALTRWRNESEHSRSHHPVFPSPRGSYLNPSRFRTRVWYPWREQADAEHLDWKTLRHYYASWIASFGGTITQLSRWMGHANFSTTANRYIHLFDDDAWGVMERMG